MHRSVPLATLAVLVAAILMPGVGATGAAAADAPSNTTPPTVSGTMRDGQIITASPGTWSSATAITYTYQWQRCDATGGACADISAATRKSRMLTSSDVGRTLRVRVTATNASGSASSTSAATDVVQALPPANTALPTISGTLQDGQLLTAAKGTWTGSTPRTYSYQWLRCDADGAACVDIAGATTSKRTLTWSDVGHTMRIRVTADNSALPGGGSALATADATGVVQALPPSNTVLPTVSGTLQDGQLVAATKGTWTGSTPRSYTYQWQRCDALGVACVDIAGATASKRLLTSSDVGRTVRVRVTADNSALPGGGVASATSAATGMIQAAPPVNTSLPVLSGTPEDGAAITTTKGSWKGSTPRIYSYQWLRCDATGAACVEIAGETTSQYRLTGDDVGRTVRARITADNSALPGGGATAATSSALALVRPALSGSAQVGATLTASGGVHAYQWLRCDAAGAACTNIAGATGSSLAVSGGDTGHTIRVHVSPAGSDGSGAINSKATVPVFSPATAPCGGLAGATPPTTYKHVIWIWYENKSYEDIIGNPNAPYFNALADQCGLATNYYGVAHVSRRDYIAATGGVIRPALGDTDYNGGYDATAPSIFGLGASWKVYMESMDTNCDSRGEDDGIYEHGHNAALFYGAIADACKQFDVPMGTGAYGPLVEDVAHGTLPAFSFAVPNGCNDMHHLCGAADVNGMLVRGEAWLKSWIDLITAAPGWQQGDTAIFVSFDEGEVIKNPSNLEEDCMATLSETCHVATLVISPYLRGARVDTLYSHYSLLKTTEEMLGLQPLLGHAADPSTASMRPGFGL